jgi:hypothetical protein
MMMSLRSTNQSVSREVPDALVLDSAVDYNEFSEGGFEEMNSMGVEQRFEEFGKEYLSGFVASKLKSTNPELCADKNELSTIANLSWVNALSSGGLTVPSLRWRNQAMDGWRWSSKIFIELAPKSRLTLVLGS